MNGTISGPLYPSRAKLVLTDITSSTSLMNFDSYDWFVQNPPFIQHPYPAPFSWQQDFGVNPLHQYQLWLYGSAINSEGGGGTTEFTVDITPEPATVLLFALGGILLRRK